MTEVKFPEIHRPNELPSGNEGFGQDKKSPEHLPKVNSPGPSQGDKETQETSLPPITDQGALTPTKTEQDTSPKQELPKPATTEQDKLPAKATTVERGKSEKQETIKPVTTEQSTSIKQESTEKDTTARNQSVEQVNKPKEVQNTEHKNRRESKAQFKDFATSSKRDRHIKTQELPRLPIIKEAVVSSREIIAKKFNSLQKRELAFKKLFQNKEIHIFDHKMLPRINPTKSNLISRLDPYTVEQGAKEMKRITRSIPSNPDSDHGYLYRKTAVDMLDPWDFLELDSVESSRRTIPRYRGNQKRRRDYPNRPPPEGSTYFPKFPNVNYPYAGSESPTRMFELDDVPKVRKQLKKKWSKRSPERVKKDYTKTKNDFYRMELDKLNEMRPTYNRPSMVNTYNAYLKNTPGSKQALNDCISGIEANLLKDQANVSLLPKQPKPPLRKSHSTMTSGRSTRQRVIKVVETPKVEVPVPRSTLQSRQTIESAG